MSLPGVTSIRCQRCGGSVAFPDQDGDLHCLICGRKVADTPTNGKRRRPRIDTIMQTPPGAFLSLLAPVLQSQDFE